MREGCLVNGPYCNQFEKWLTVKTKAAYAITCHSGTQALEIIARFKLAQYYRLNSAATKPVINLPNLTYPATLNAFATAGWNIKLVDTDKNGIMLFEKPSSNMIQCVVGLYGAKPWDELMHPIDPDIIVDGAQHWLVADGFNGIGMAISFDPTKNLPASGNGGAVVTDNLELYNFAKNYRDNGKINLFVNSGTNSKMSEQDCAQILVRTKYIDAWQLRREKIAAHWISAFAELPVQCIRGNTAHSNQKFVLYTESRDKLNAYMKLHGVKTKIHYPYTLSELPMTKNFVRTEMISASMMLSRGVISLPMYPELSDGEVEYIADMLKDFYK